MNCKLIPNIFLYILIIPIHIFYANANENPIHTCGSMENVFNVSEQAKLYNKNLQEQTTNFLKNTNKIASTEKIIIPVVVHVFGTDFGGSTVTSEKIAIALNKTNEDFKGLNDDYSTVNSLFLNVRGNLDIEFQLAKLDPDGNPTSGINYYDVESGFAEYNDQANASVQYYAWDNFSYMNLYIMLDLHGNGVTNNSGYAYFPNLFMTENNLDRIVYNGRYLFGNTDKEFASVLTHEYGHWLNLYHTFQDGCTEPNDGVDDTPPVISAGSGCNALNCHQNVINGENYMDYNSWCMKMFTEGQVIRMQAALQDASRVNLWSEENLIKTGLKNVSSAENEDNEKLYVLNENIIQKDFLKIEFKSNSIKKISIIDILGVELVNSVTSNSYIDLNTANLSNGIYFLKVEIDRNVYLEKIIKN